MYDIMKKRRITVAVTIKEVALLAGVSTATVSRVIHNHDRISDSTKQVVRDAMSQLGYIPNAAASSLAGKNPKTIGIVLPNNPGELFKNPFFINAMRGISVYAQSKGYFLLYSFSRDEQEEIDFIQNYIRSGWVSGIILLASREHDRCVEYLNSVSFPFVLIGRPEDPQHTYWVDNDNFQAMYQVVNYLIDKGYRKIGFVGGPPTFRVTYDRMTGYRQAMNNRGFFPEDSMVFQGDDFSEESGYLGAERLLTLNGLDAIATTDDQLAFGVLEKLHKEHREDIAVTGFNNTVRGTYQHPGLTTVDVNADQLGERAAQLLINLLEQQTSNHQIITPNHYLVETQLIPRDTA